MLGQGCREVIVVDYSCPEGTGDYVEKHLPAVRVLRAAGETQFSNWKARNLGASAATADVLVFCDADIILAPGAIEWVSDNLPDNAFGYFDAEQTSHLNTTREILAQNQLRGFLVVPSQEFEHVGGYDEVLQGYASGGDTDLSQRLQMADLIPFALDPKIIQSVVPHHNKDRIKHHVDPITVSYGAGMLYRTAKLSLLKLQGRLELPLTARRKLYEAARTAVQQLGHTQDTVTLAVQANVRPVGMPRQLGYQAGKQTVTLKVELSMQHKLPATHQ
jgi:glycosyltransferase involved in cell wall biosynthesis